MLNKTGSIETLLASKEALSRVRGLKSILLRGIFINYLIFFCLTFFLNIFFYLKIITPIIDWIFGIGIGVITSLSNLIMWGIQLSASAIFVLIFANKGTGKT